MPEGAPEPSQDCRRPPLEEQVAVLQKQVALLSRQHASLQETLRLVLDSALKTHRATETLEKSVVGEQPFADFFI